MAKQNVVAIDGRALPPAESMPTFTIEAIDPCAELTIQMWIDLRMKYGLMTPEDEDYRHALDTAIRMALWRTQHNS